jgi:hypothetical protein
MKGPVRTHGYRLVYIQNVKLSSPRPIGLLRSAYVKIDLQPGHLLTYRAKCQSCNISLITRLICSSSPPSASQRPLSLLMFTNTFESPPQQTFSLPYHCHLLSAWSTFCQKLKGVVNITHIIKCLDGGRVSSGGRSTAGSSHYQAIRVLVRAIILTIWPLSSLPIFYA